MKFIISGVIRPLRQTWEFRSRAPIAISVLTSSDQIRGLSILFFMVLFTLAFTYLVFSYIPPSW